MRIESTEGGRCRLAISDAGVLIVVRYKADGLKSVLCRFFDVFRLAREYGERRFASAQMCR